MPIQGKPRFDTLALGELSAKFFQAEPELSGKAAFTDSTTGQTHGFTTSTSRWSKDTIDRLKELRLSMEQDLAARDFTNAVPSFQAQLASGPEQLSLGLSEHLAEAAQQY